MGIRRFAPLLLAAVVGSACTDQDQPDTVTSPAFMPPPPPPTATCDPNSLNGLISAYFPGNTGNPVKTIKDGMIAATTDAAKRDAAFAILDSIGSISRNDDFTVDPVDGSNLAQEIIKCGGFHADQFSPTFPTDAIYNFAPALTAAGGGAFYTRGGNAGGTDTVVGALIEPGDTTVLSGFAPPPAVPPGSQPTWTQILSVNTGSEGRVLLYGFRTSEDGDPLEYEWATMPPAAEFSPGAIVAVCDDNTASTVMVHESNVGVLAFSPGNPICGTTISLVMSETGWGPRALAARVARLLTPPALQAAVIVNSGSGGTVTKAKSKFKTKPVEIVTLRFDIKPPKKIFLSQPPVTIRVRATTPIDNVTTGVNGTCVYVTASENNGANLALLGPHECDDEPPGSISAITESLADGSAGYATFEINANKTGGATLTASSTDATGETGVIGRDGQVFINDVVRTSFNP